MRYQGSAVANEEYIERGYALPQERPSFEVVSGGGLDARARRGVAPRSRRSRETPPSRPR